MIEDDEETPSPMEEESPVLMQGQSAVTDDELSNKRLTVV